MSMSYNRKVHSIHYPHIKDISAYQTVWPISSIFFSFKLVQDGRLIDLKK